MRILYEISIDFTCRALHHGFDEMHAVALGADVVWDGDAGLKAMQKPVQNVRHELEIRRAEVVL